MWERQRDPKHVFVQTTKTPPDQRPKDREGLCWALPVNATDVAEPYTLATSEPCTYQAHHLGPHSWQAAAAAAS